MKFGGFRGILVIFVKLRTFHGSGARNPLNIATIMYVFHPWPPELAFLRKCWFLS